MKYVHHIFEEQAERTPGAVAVLFKNQQMTYAELDGRADAVAEQLRELGIGPDAVIGICAERSFEMVTCVLAILKAGGAYVPLDPSYPTDRIKLMIENARVSVLLTHTLLRDKLKLEMPLLKMIFVDESAVPSCHEPAFHASDDEGHTLETVVQSPLAYIIHTSGSTGVPKGVAMPHGPLLNLMDWQIKNSRVGQSARTLQFASLSFDVSFQEMFSTWGSGGTLVLVDETLRRDPVALLTFIAAQNIERLFLPFVALQQLAQEFNENSPAPTSLREIITAGEQLRITPKIVTFFESLPDCTLQNQYGPSETHVVTVFTLSGRPSQWPALPPIGRPIPSARIYLLDDQRRSVAPGKAGEICVAGACLAQGYIHRPDLTAETFLRDPFSGDPDAKLYKTGDFGRFQADGNIEFLGRADHQLKIRGFRIELGEIEAALRHHPNIRDTVVIAREDHQEHKRLVAYFISRPGHPTTAKELRRFLAERLPDYMLPSRFVSLESLPLTASGKVDRKNLPAPVSEKRLTETLDEPRTPVEETLIDIWCQVFGVQHIGLEDNFFDLGGDSLMAVQVVSRLRRAFQAEVPVSSLFASPTIALLAQGIASGRWKNEAASVPISPAARQGPLPLSFSQRRLWFINQLEPDNFADNVSAAVALDGDLDVLVLEQCLNRLVRRHEILRTIFVENDGEPAQVIMPDLSLRLPLIDLAENAHRDAYAKRVISEETQRLFDLRTGPLIRCTMLRLAARRHILLVVMHHIISDGWSLELFFDELARLYDGQMNAQTAALSPLNLQYADYALWQRDKAHEEVFSKHAAHWKETLANAPPSLKLPTDHLPTSGINSLGARCCIPICPDLSDAMQQLNRRNNSTPFMTLLTALMVLLNRWTGKTDIIVGTVSAGRTRSELENLIGCFMNCLPIRLVMKGNENGLDLLARVKAAVLESQTHQNCPFERIVETIKPRRHVAQNPIYNVGFLLQNVPQVAFATRHVNGTFISTEAQSALLDLRFVAAETKAGYSLACEYRSGLFERHTIEQLLASFCVVLETLVQKPDVYLHEFAIKPELAEQSRKSHSSSDMIAIAATFTVEPLAEPLEFWLRELELPAQIQFAPYNQVFQQLLDSASLLSRNSRGLNVVLVQVQDWLPAPGKNAETALNLEHRIDQTLAELISAVKSAAARSTIQMLLCICPSSKLSRADRTSANFLGRLHHKITNELSCTTNVQLRLPEQLAAMYPVDDIFDPCGDELGHVPYTLEFFTGLATTIARAFNSQKRLAPKVIVLDCDHTLWSGVCGEDGPDGIILSAPHRALQEFMRVQSDSGRLLCLCSKNNPHDVHAVFERRTEMPLGLQDFAATRLNWLPKSENLKALAKELNLGVESFVLVDDNAFECAEVLANCPGAQALQLPQSPELIQQFLEHCWIFDAQPLTSEDTQRTDYYRHEHQRIQARTDSITLSDFLSKLELRVVIGNLSPKDLPRVAQLTRRTNQFNCAPQCRTEAEIQGLPKQFETLVISVSDRFGDYGLVGWVMGRLEDDSLKVEDFLLSCRALGRGVEHRILAHLGRLAKARGAASVEVHFVCSAKNQPALDFLESVGGEFRQPLNGGYVFRFPAEFAAELTFASQSAAADSAALPAAETQAARMQTCSAFAPWRWIALEANQVQKIQALIEAKAGVRRNLPFGIDSPETEAERELCLIWQELLRIEHVGVRDNFFELGGHSLLAVRMFAQIEKRLHVKLPIVAIFQSPTVALLAKAVTELGSPSSALGLLPIQSGDGRPPLFLVHGAGGDVLWGYANLARHTDQGQPIYGIQACAAREFTTLEEMASRYVENVRAFQPVGPYYLGGYCFGGNVAQEMARQLQTQGETVAFLGLLDCAPANCGYETLDWRRPMLFLEFSRNIVHWIEDFFHLKPAERRSLVMRKLRTLPRKLWKRVASPQWRQEFDLEEFIDVRRVSEREICLWKNHLGLLVRHVSKPYGGHITLFRTRSHPLVCSFEKDFGWGKLAAKVTIKHTPGSHEGIFLEPHVRYLARELEQSLDASHRAPHVDNFALSLV